MCAMEPQAGGFKIDVIKSMELIPQYPVYANESSATSARRRTINSTKSESMVYTIGDTEMFTHTIYQVVRMGKIPQHLLMGLDAIEMLAAKTELEY